MSLMRAVMKGLVGSTIQTRNIFYAEVDPAGTDTAASLWEEYFDAIYIPIEEMTSTLFQTTTYTLEIKNIDEWLFTEENPYTFVGTGDGNPYNSMISPVLIAKTVVGSAIGRKFLPPTSEASADANSLVAGAVLMLAEALVGYITPFVTGEGSTFDPGIITKDDEWRVFVGGFISPILGTMRRRKEGRGL